jgi:GT2 family glycosyltransferase
MSMLGLSSYAQKHNIAIAVQTPTGADLYMNRNQAVAPLKTIYGSYPRDYRLKKPYNGLLTFDRIFWIDTDMVFDPEQVIKLVDDNEDIVTGMCPKGLNNFRIAEYAVGYYGFLEGGVPYLSDLPDRKVIPPDTDVPADGKAFIQGPTVDTFEAWKAKYKNAKGLCPVDYCGSAFVCVKPKVYETLEYPWYRTTIAEHGQMVIECSEDVGFCWRAKKAGFAIYADPSVQIGHEKAQEIRGR